MSRSVLLPAEERLGALITVLDYVRTHGAATRPTLVETTGLSRAVVTQRVVELLDYGLLVEGELAPSMGGRAPRTIRFRADAGYLLVADLGATSIDVAITDLAGKIIGHRQERSDIASGPTAVLDRVDELFQQCLSAADELPGELWAIGIGLPGPVEFESGMPDSPPIMPGWDRYPVRRRFEQYGVPLWVDNDVNLMALGELRAGVARGHDNIVFIKIGTGIGAGLIVGGKLHRGAQGCAGDVGHVQLVDGTERVCRCGNIGCLEALAGGAAIARDAEAAAREGRSPVAARLLAEKGALEASDVAFAASHGDPVSLELIGGAGRLIGRMLAAIVNLFNPSLIVIGGGVSATGDVLLATIRESVYRRSLPLATRDLAIKRSSLDGLGGVIGAAAMVTDELFAPVQLTRWIEAGTPRAPAVSRQLLANAET
jgi:glucokinase-like ROK family protein